MRKTIIIGADIVPTDGNIELFENGDINSLLDKGLIEMLAAADYAILNLETPLTDVLAPIKKCGPNLYAPSGTINGIKKINPYFFTLANNHIMDQGAQGLQNTIKLLEENNIDFAGAGENIYKIRKNFIKNFGDVQLGIYCCAEHEFSIASKNNPGANPYDPLESFDEVRDFKKRCNYVIVLYHGGKELYQYPSPHLRKVFQKFADSGADLVIAQHTHCIGCREAYNGSILVYGQGNFLFDRSSDPLWQEAVLVSLSIKDNNKEIDFIPIQRKGNVVTLVDGDEANIILNNFERRSKEILKDGFVESKFEEYSKTMEYDYLCPFMGRIGSGVYRLKNMFGKRVMDIIFRNKNFYVMKNYLECESHNEVFKKILKIKANERIK